MKIGEVISNQSGISLRGIWKLSMFLYIVCNTAFASKSYLMNLSTATLYFFVGVSLVCILVQKEVKLNMFLISSVAFFFVLMIGMLYSTSAYAQSYVYDYFVLLCLLVCTLNYIKDKNDILFIISAIMIGGFIQNLYIVSIYGGDFLDILNDLSSGDDSNRIGRVAGNVNDVGLKSCYSAIIALFFILNEKILSKMKKTVYFIICIVCVFFSIITASKKVLILLMIGVLFLFLQKKDKNKNPLVFFKNLIITVAVGAVLIYLIMNLEYFTYMRVRLEQFFDLLINGGGNSSDNKRVLFIKEGFEVFWQHPIFGDGTACSFNYFDTYSHSNFVEILMCNGIIGFITFYFCYPFVVYKGFVRVRKNRQLEEKNLDLAPLCLFFFVSIMILSVALVYYTFIYYQILLAISAEYILESKYDSSVSSR